MPKCIKKKKTYPLTRHTVAITANMFICFFPISVVCVCVCMCFGGEKVGRVWGFELRASQLLRRQSTT
jgi:hypothetical protein